MEGAWKEHGRSMEGFSEVAHVSGTGSVALARLADAILDEGAGDGLLSALEVLWGGMLPFGGAPLQGGGGGVSLAVLLAELEHELAGVVRDDGVVVLEDDALQLQRPLALLFQVARLQRVLEPRVVEWDHVEG